MQKTVKSLLENRRNLQKGVLQEEKIFGFSATAPDENPYKDKLDLEPDDTIERVRSYTPSKTFFDAESLSELYMPDPDMDMESLDMVEGNIDYIEKGKLVVRVMDKHNFYETEMLTEEDLKKSGVGLLTKLWICISKAVEE